MATTTSHFSHLAQAPIELAVRAALAAQGRRFDNEDVARATSYVMAGLTPDALRTIASSGTASSHLLQALIPQATAQITNGIVPWNIHGPARDTSRFGGGRAATALWGGAAYAALGGGSDGDADGGSSGPSSSLRFDETYLRSPAGREMQAFAREQGLEWAANRPEILRLGRDAIALFARTGFTRQSFDGLREVGFEGGQIARIVRRAEQSGQDANHVARMTRDSVRIFGGDDPERRRQWREMIYGFYDNPASDDAWRRLDGALTRMEREGTAEQQNQAREQREIAERIRQAEARPGRGRSGTQRIGSKPNKERHRRRQRELLEKLQPDKPRHEWRERDQMWQQLMMPMVQRLRWSLGSRTFRQHR